MDPIQKARDKVYHTIRKAPDLGLAEEVSWISRALASTTLREAPLTNDVALGASWLRLEHNDPADHFIAASAKAFVLTLVTSDHRLLPFHKQCIPILS
jgi:PIN domain nuclease of toxin-antitoxin system